MENDTLHEMHSIQNATTRIYHEGNLSKEGFLLCSVFDQRLEQKPFLLLGINPGGKKGELESHLSQNVEDAFGRQYSEDLLNGQEPYYKRFRELARMVWGEVDCERYVRHFFYLNMCLFRSPDIDKRNMTESFHKCESILWKIIKHVSPQVIITHSAVWESYKSSWGVRDDHSTDLGEKRPIYYCRGDQVDIGGTIVPLLFCIPHWTGKIPLSSEELKRAAELLKHDLESLSAQI